MKMNEDEAQQRTETANLCFVLGCLFVCGCLFVYVCFVVVVIIVVVDF